MILQRYLLKEVSKTFFAVFIVIFTIILSTQVLRALSAVSLGKISPDLLFVLVTLTNISSMTLIFPLVMYLSIILTSSRLYNDSEVVAMTSCGIGPTIFFKSLWPFVVFLFSLELVLVLFINPWSNVYIDQIKQVVSNKADVDLLESGRFNISTNSNKVIYIDTKDDDKHLSQIFIHIKGTQEGEHDQVIMAKEGYIDEIFDDGSRYLVLLNGHRYDGTAGSEQLKLISFKEYGVLIKKKAWKEIEMDEDGRDLSSLWAEKQRSIFQSELQWRISMILSIVILFLLSVPLGRVAPRKGRFSMMLPAILVYFVYYTMLKASQGWIEKGLPYWIGLWWVHLVFFMLFIYLYGRQVGWFNRKAAALVD